MIKLLKWCSVATVGLLLTASGTLIAYLSYRLAHQQQISDAPALHLELKAGTPLYSIDTGTTWQAELLNVRLADFLRLKFAAVILPVYVSNGLAKASAANVLEEKMAACESDLDRIMMRIPLRLTISNNGHRDTTVVSGRLTVTGYDNPNHYSGDLGDFQVFIPEGAITNLARFQNVEFKNPQSMPKMFWLQAISASMKELMLSFDPKDADWQSKVPRVMRSVLETSSPDLLNTTRPTVIVEFADQRGNTCRAESPLCGEAPFEVTGSRQRLDETNGASRLHN